MNRTIALLALALGLTAANSAQNLLVNGGFEAPGLPNPGDGLFLPNGSTAAPGWVSVDNVASGVAADNGYRRAPYYGHPASEGEHFIVIDNNSFPSPSLNGIYQYFATVPGQAYGVTFDAATEISYGTPGLLRVSAGSTVIHYTLANANAFPLPPSPPYTFTGWSTYSFTFTATSNTTRLQFSDEGFQIGGDSSNGNASPLIDNVRVFTTQNLVANGSFEGPLISISTWSLISTNALAPWQTDGDTFEIWSDGMIGNGQGPYYSADGRQNLEVKGGGTAVWQTLPTIIGEEYQLSFHHSPRGGLHTFLTVSINSNIIATLDEDGTQLTTFNWKSFTTNFTATNKSTTICFSDGPVEIVGAGSHIDNVVLAPVPAVLAGPVTNAANGHFYYLLAQNTWTASEAAAVALGGHLVTINDQAEQDWVYQTFSTFAGINRNLWIGLADQNNTGLFSWASGEAVNYTAWAPGEPSFGLERWVNMTLPGYLHSGKWNNENNVLFFLDNGVPVPLHGVVEVAPTNKNFVANGSFEFGSTGWASTGELYILGPPAGSGVYVTGSHSARIGGGNIPNSTLSQTLAVIAGTNYLLSLATAANSDSAAGWVGAVRVEIVGPVNTLLASASYTDISPGPLRGTNDFIRRLLPFTTPASVESVTLLITDISPNGGGSVDPTIDDVSVSLQAPTSATNLLVNGSFELPRLLTGYAHVPLAGIPGWGTSDDSFEVWTSGDQVPSAEGWQNVEILSRSQPAAIWQTVPTIPGEDYDLVFYHTPRPSVDSTLTVLINSQPIAVLNEGGSALTAFRWRKFRTNFTATATLTTISFSDVSASASGTHLDNVAFYPAVPYTYTTNNGTITITGYTGSGGAVTIPTTINGLPVISIGSHAFSHCASLTSIMISNNVTLIGDWAFSDCINLTSVVLPNSVTRIGDGAFSGCGSLASIFIKGNAPSAGSNVFSGANKVTVDYLPGTTGWGPTFAGRPTALVTPGNARLLMRATGQGTVSPNFNNAVLMNGRAYSMAAAGANGHTFSKWITSLNWSGVAVVTTPKLAFTMQPGLTVEAVFVDVARPVVTITSPVTGQRISNALATVRGRASDNAQIAQVFCQINTSDWIIAAGTSNWTASLPLAPGTNRVRVYAVDAADHVSPTNTVTFIHVATSQLSLLTNGLGRITRSFTGNTLEVDRGYSVTAVPSSGQLFSNWVGTVTATNNPLKFLMQSNMVLQANFVPNPYLALKGSYAGLFRPPSIETVSGTNAGSLALTLTERGTFSGSLRLAGGALAFTGGFDVGRQATVRVARTGKAPLWLNLGFDSQSITGQVSAAEWTAALLALRRATASSNAFAGRYSMLVMGDLGATNSPPGDSPLALSVSAPSSITVSGTMADGSAVTLATGHSAEGMWPFYASLYGGRGLVIGWMSCATNPGSQEVLWVKPPDLAARYPAGFREERLVALKRYLSPAPKQSAVAWSSTGPGHLIIGGGNLPGRLFADVLVTNNLIKSLSGSLSNLSLVITNSNGRFAGSFLHPVTRKPVAVRGVLVQEGLPWAPPEEQVTVGGGWFLGTNQGGYLWLEPKR